MGTHELYQVDAFTSTPFHGNPAAVVPLERWPDDDNWLQQVALENNLSETAFLVPADDGAWRLRWLTPAVEVDLCGHATVASAHILWETGRLPKGQVARFDTRSGRLTATPLDDGWIELDLPALPCTKADPPKGLLEGLGVDTHVFVGRSRFDYLVELESVDDVRRLEPDIGLLKRVDARGVCVTAAADDFVSRFFGPAVGVNEDPATGSSHCILGPYWAAKLGKDRLSAKQLSPRGGELRVHARGDRVGVAGQAVTVIRGTLAA